MLIKCTIEDSNGDFYEKWLDPIKPQSIIIRRALKYYLNSDLMISKKDRVVIEEILR
jgi:hypothetical protein